jgi:hypothetical protein
LLPVSAVWMPSSQVDPASVRARSALDDRTAAFRNASVARLIPEAMTPLPLFSAVDVRLVPAAATSFNDTVRRE